MINSFVLIKKINLFDSDDNFIMDMQIKEFPMSHKTYFKWFRYNKKILKKLILGFYYFEVEFYIIESNFI